MPAELSEVDRLLLWWLPVVQVVQVQVVRVAVQRQEPGDPPGIVKFDACGTCASIPAITGVTDVISA